MAWKQSEKEEEYFARIVSTIYLRYHYVIDLIAGAVIAAGCLAAGFRLHAWWNRLYEARQSCLIKPYDSSFVLHLSCVLSCHQRLVEN